MAPTQPTVSQWVEELEDAVANLETRVSQMVSEAVEKAVGAMKNSLGELLLKGQADNLQKNNSEMESLISRLEGRITRSREQQEAKIHAMKNDQEHFQSEVRSTITSLQTLHNHTSEKIEGSINQAETSARGEVQTPGVGGNIGGLFGSPQVDKLCWRIGAIS